MKTKEIELFQDSVVRLMVETKSYLDNLGLIPRDSDIDIVLLALLSKSIIVTEAITTLVSHGFEDEGYGLCRTSLEIELTIRYLTNKDTGRRCWRYLYFFAKDKTEWFRLIKKYYPEMQPKVIPSAMHEQLSAIYASPHKWSECSDGVKGFAAEPDSFEKREDGSPLDENFYYEVLYKWMSQYVHATISCLEPEHITHSGEIFKVHRGAGRSRHGGGALRTSMLNVYSNLQRVMRALNMTIPEELTSRYEDVISAMRGQPPDMSSASK
jgi:hypothetical protein